MATVLYVSIIFIFMYILLGFLVSEAIKGALSRHRCECKNFSRIAWEVPFDPNWIFTLSGEFHLLYSGKCRLCGKKYQALFETGGVTIAGENQEDKPEDNCCEKRLGIFLEYCLANKNLPPKNITYGKIYKHLDACPKCSDKLSVLLEKNDEFGLLLTLKNLPASMAEFSPEAVSNFVAN